MRLIISFTCDCTDDIKGTDLQFPFNYTYLSLNEAIAGRVCKQQVFYRFQFKYHVEYQATTFDIYPFRYHTLLQTKYR